MKIPFILTAVIFSALGHANSISGFEDPILLSKVMSGKIVIQRLIDTDRESKLISRAYFNRVSPDAYQDLTVSYQKYPDLFEEVHSGKQTSADLANQIFTYWLDVFAKVGFLGKHVYPEGKHILVRSKGANAEARVRHTLTNYQDLLDVANQEIRLIPYENGFLVEDKVHVRARKVTMVTKPAKKKFVQFFMNYTEVLRNELQGGY